MHGFRLATLAASLLAAAAMHPARAESVDSYPSHPIKFIVPHQPGGLMDQFSRALGQYLSNRFGQPVVVENRPGANQTIGAQAAARAEPDGYTLFLGTQTALVFNPIAYKHLPYDPQRDFAPIAMLFNTPFYLLVNPAVPARNVQELIALAKSEPGKLTYASIGQASSQQLAAEMFKSRTGVDILHVPYSGTPQAAIALQSGEVDMTFEGGGTSVENVRKGKLRALAATGAKRTAELPDVPTLSETIPGLDISVWIGLVAPAGTPRPIVDKLNAAVTDMLKAPGTLKKFGPLGVDPAPSTPDYLAERIRNDGPEWAKVMRAAGIRPE